VRDRAAKQGLIRLQRDLERRSLESCQAIKSVFLSSLASLSSAHEAKSNHTKDHSLRVARISSALAERCNLCDQRFSETLRTASLLHDIGKIGVPDEILAKPGPLSDMEFHVIKTYPLISESILKPLSGDDPDLPSIVRHQHERWDGRGYPDGLKGEEIPMGARIIAVADAFDAMVCDRPYRSRLPSNRVIEILRDERGHQWDRRVVDALLDYAASGDSSDLGTRLVLARDASLSAVTLRSLRPAA
jgi:HD-GYP domain-containing protein (c-di-GMP phosphodiesterase class II)